MTRRKTEAWLVVDESGNEFLYPYKQDSDDKIHDLDADGETGLVIPLVRRDPKAEAVVRAAEKLVRWWEEMGTACNPGSLNADPADRMMGAVHALLASRKRAKK